MKYEGETSRYPEGDDRRSRIKTLRAGFPVGVQTLALGALLLAIPVGAASSALCVFDDPPEAAEPSRAVAPTRR